MGRGHGRAGGKRNQAVGGGGPGGRVLPTLLPQAKRESGLPQLGKFANKMEGLLRRQKQRQQLAVAPPPGDAAAQGGKRRRLGPGAAEAPAPAQMAAFVMDAARRGHDFAARQDFLETPGGAAGQPARQNRSKEISRRRFWREFQKVVTLSDVLLEVLDARDPLGGRLTDVERAVSSQHSGRKQFVLVLNKVDLIPRENAERWLEYFRREDIPVVAFSAAAGGKAAAQEKSKSKTAEDPTRRCVDHLFEVLRRFQKTTGGGRRKITVGVIGYPNVGKSSVINALKRSRVVGVGNTPGFTTTAQEVNLQQHIKVVDCPGVVMGEGGDADIVLRNAMKIEQISDPVRPVELIWERCGGDRIASAYQLPEEEMNTFEDFVLLLARKLGRLQRGGQAMDDDVCRHVLRDWNNGLIPFYTVPPSDRDAGAGVPTTLAAGPTDMELDQETQILSALSAPAPGGFVAIAASKPQPLTYGVDDDRLIRRGLKRGAPGEDESEEEEEDHGAGRCGPAAAAEAAAAEEYDDRDEIEELARDIAKARLEEAQAAATAGGRRRAARAAAGASPSSDSDDDSDPGRDARLGRSKTRLAALRREKRLRLAMRKRQKLKERRVVRAKRQAAAPGSAAAGS